MQVRCLPRQIIRNGALAARLLAAKTPNIEAERRRAAVARWRRAMANGPTAEQAAQAVGVARSNLYRWEKTPEPRSRRPPRPTAQVAARSRRGGRGAPRREPDVGQAQDRRLLKREGEAASVSTVGRILTRLRRAASSLPRRSCGAGPAPGASASTQASATPSVSPRAEKPGRPANSSRSTPSSSTSDRTGRRGGAIKHFTAYDPVAKWTIGHVATSDSAGAARALLDKVLTSAPFKVRDPGRRRVRVHVRLQRPLPRQRPLTRRPAAQEARPHG
jgi:putative transposase